MNLFHRHGPWEIVSAYCDGQMHWNSPSAIHCLLTNIVLRCKECHKLKEKVLMGRHTLEALKAEDPEISKVLREYEK